MTVTDEMREAARTTEVAYSLDATGDLVSRQYLAMRALDPDLAWRAVVAAVNARYEATQAQLAEARAQLAAIRPVVEAAVEFVETYAIFKHPIRARPLHAAVRAWREAKRGA